MAWSIEVAHILLPLGAYIDNGIHGDFIFGFEKQPVFMLFSVV